MKEKMYLEGLYESEIALGTIEELEESLILERHHKFSETHISKERALALELEILERERGEF